jgi:hypothetical protein
MAEGAVKDRFHSFHIDIDKIPEDWSWNKDVLMIGLRKRK